jgi:hypothetical protein
MAGSATVSRSSEWLAQDGGRRLECITVTWTADASGGSMPSVSLGKVFGTIHRLVTDPGSTAPTDNYTIKVNDSDGIDVLGGAGASRDTANTEEAIPVVSGTSIQRSVADTLAFVLTGNSVNSATGVAKLYVIC